MTDIRLSKVEILIQQKKFSDAEKILRDLLTTDSGNIHYLSLLAEVNLQQDRLGSAKEIINNAIGLAPDAPYLFYMKARISIQEQNLVQAEADIRQAVEQNPYDADYFALLGHIKLHRKDFNEALNFANKSLEIDAENILGLNTRSSALLKLDKKEESFKTIEGALREDPNNAYTHANYGWGLLEKGNHEKALEHFREALKSDPGFQYAQAGMIQALKARHPFYRLFLRYAFWMGNLTAKYQWAVILGFYAGVRILRTIAEKNEAIAPYLIPLILLLSLFAFSTWVITPISNLFLRLNKYGQFLLDRNEKMSSNFVGLSLLTCFLGLILFFILSDEKYLTIAAYGFAMMVPFSVMFSPSKHRYSLLIYAVSMAVVGLIAIGVAMNTGEIFNTFTAIFLIGFVVFQWVANFLTIRG
jgi:tetratricopeptide (TPR) repeat protein